MPDKRESESTDERVAQVGLMAYGQYGDWDVSVDVTISGPDKWYLQVEGPLVYLYFEIASPDVIAEVLSILETPATMSAGVPAQCHVGSFHEVPVLLLRDDEFPDRCFFYIGTGGMATMRVTILGENLAAFAAAARQAFESLNGDST